MNDDKALTTNGTDPRELALLKAVGFDRLQPEQRELALSISKRYELDPLLKHLVMIEGRAYITRDGLLHIAHRSGQLDGIETSEPAIVDGFWRATASVYRKDMSRPFTYTGRYPTSGGNQKYAPEMAVKVAEVMALRRAFDVAAPTAEERWDAPSGTEANVSASAAQPSLAERAAARAAALQPAAAEEASAEPPLEEDVADEDEPGAALGRLAFLEQLRVLKVSGQQAVERTNRMFPDVSPKELTDEQRAEVIASLRVEPPVAVPA